MSAVSFNTEVSFYHFKFLTCFYRRTLWSETCRTAGPCHTFLSLCGERPSTEPEGSCSKDSAFGLQSSKLCPVYCRSFYTKSWRSKKFYHYIILSIFFPCLSVKLKLRSESFKTKTLSQDGERIMLFLCFLIVTSKEKLTVLELSLTGKDWQKQPVVTGPGALCVLGINHNTGVLKFRRVCPKLLSSLRLLKTNLQNSNAILPESVVNTGNLMSFLY